MFFYAAVVIGITPAYTMTPQDNIIFALNSYKHVKKIEEGEMIFYIYLVVLPFLIL